MRNSFGAASYAFAQRCGKVRLIFMYVCPKCKLPLSVEKNSYKCRNGHCYDISSKGYVNLILGSKSGGHGDNKEMLAARRQFLSLDHYLPIVAQLADIIQLSIGAENIIRILDAGCGEGYYTSALYEELKKRGISTTIYGVDVSKEGIAMAAKKYKSCFFSVASVNALPFSDGSFDVVLSLFAPIAEKEFYRVLKTAGSMITVSPSPRHLLGLKKEIYDNVYENEETTFVPQFFAHAESSAWNGEMMLFNNLDINNLFKMTPYYYKTDEKGRLRVNALQSLTTEIGFMFYRYTK